MDQTKRSTHLVRYYSRDEIAAIRIIAISVAISTLFSTDFKMMSKSSESRSQSKFSPISAKNMVNTWRIILSVFVLQFPGEVGARNFSKNPR